MAVVRTKHYVIRFQGSLNATFTFDDYNYEDMFEDELHDHPIKFCDDGYLYIQGKRISNREESFNNFLEGINDGGMGYNNSGNEVYIDATFAIDRTGYITCVKHNHSGNKVDRFFSKLLGF